MEMDLAELGRVGRASMAVAVIGVAVPFVLGSGVALGFGETGNTALFIGAALTATSVGITARVFGDLRALATTEARVVLGRGRRRRRPRPAHPHRRRQGRDGRRRESSIDPRDHRRSRRVSRHRHGRRSGGRAGRLPGDRTVVEVIGDARRRRPRIRAGILVGRLVGQPGADHRSVRRRPGDRAQRPPRPHRARVRLGRQRVDPRVLRADRARRRPRGDGQAGGPRPRRGAAHRRDRRQARLGRRDRRARVSTGCSWASA